jgi:hypothetical protein
MNKQTTTGLALLATIVLVALLIFLRRPPTPLPPSVSNSLGPSLHDAAQQSADAVRQVRQTLSLPHAGSTPGAPTVLLQSGPIVPSSVPSAATPRHARSSARGYPWMLLFDGPIQPEWRASLEEAGAAVRAYLPVNALLIEAPANLLPALREWPHLAWSGEYRPAHKLQPLLAALARKLPAQPIPFTLQAFSPDDVDALVRELSQRGATDLRPVPARRWGWVRGVAPAQLAADMALLPEVQWIEHHEVPRLLNDAARAADRLNVDVVRDALGIDGTGQIVAVADTGLDTGNLATIHPDFEGQIHRVFDIGRLTNWSDTYYHGTHVAGSILGTGAASGGQYAGVAPGAKLVVQSVITDANALNLPDDLNELYLPTHEVGARVHSDSWGSAVYGAYNADSMTTDEFVWDHPDMLIAFASGNQGADSDSDGVVDLYSLNAPASAKNVLAVGASESGRLPGVGGLASFTYGQKWSYDYRVPPISTDLISSSPEGAPQGIVAFSSRGPTTDGRIKPDVVAPGSDIISCRSRASSDFGWGLVPDNHSYCFMGGTSMATPLASGAALLVRQYAVDILGIETPSAALLKAALVGGARSLAPGQYGTNEFREIPSPRPSVVEGWGQIDVGNTLSPSNGIQSVFIEGPEPLETAQSHEIPFLVQDGQPLTAVLAYSDYPSSLAAAIHLVNDLDLRLVAPDGTEFHPNGLAEPDRLNNVESIDVASPATGAWTLVVSAYNVPQGPQPYAAYLRGKVQMPIQIDHLPLDNSASTNQPYLVAADVRSLADFDPSSVRLFWNTTESHAHFNVLPMASTNGSRFEASIPPQPVGTRISYYLQAGPADMPARHPAAAPAELHLFEITPPLSLLVEGDPAELFSVEPPYGETILASNVAIRAQAFFHAVGTNGARTACIGWTGSGSVPAIGTNDVAEFTLLENSSLEWLWQDQVSLAQASAPEGAVLSLTWHPLDGVANSATAPESHEADGADLTFAGWQLDGDRYPADNLPSPRQLLDVPMPAPRSAVATYLPTDLDADLNQLPDWFEMRHFGQLGQNRFHDPDGDGYENELEAADHTDPFDFLSIPSPPAIDHVPLPATNHLPAPWTVSAEIADNYRVASAHLHWQRNGGTWRTLPMTNASGSDSYSVHLPSPARDGDRIAYRLSATDPAGFYAQTPTRTVAVSYARIDLSPDAIDAHAPANSLTNRHLYILNPGSQPLDVSFDVVPVGFFDDVEAGTNGWTRPDGNADWNVDSFRSLSPSNAWYCGQYLTRTYRDATHAALSTPPILLGVDSPSLSFMHWAHFEFDTDLSPDGKHYWDSGVLEISDNGGATWNSLVPDGGYPGLVTSNSASPFAPETPCFADTDGWEPVTADLSAYAGSEVRIRFRFGADLYVVGEGWYIDDVRVSPATDVEGWLSPPLAAAAVPPSFGTIFPVALDTAPIPPMATAHSAIRIHHNDPEQPSPLLVPISLHNSTRRVRVSTSGPGQASPPGETLVQSNYPFAIAFEADPDHFIADLAANETPLPLPDVVSSQTLQWASLPGNLDLYALFSPILPEDAVDPAWLAQYGLTNRNWMAEASLDPDRDGLLTWQEAQLDSSPVDPADAPLLAHIIPPQAPGQPWRLVWHAYTNADLAYAILSSTNLASPFVPQSPLPAAPPVMTSPPLLPDHRFFGLRLQPGSP